MGFGRKLGNFFSKTFTPKKYEAKQQAEKERRLGEREAPTGAKKPHENKAPERQSIQQVKQKKSKAVAVATKRLSKAEAKRRKYQKIERKAKKELNNIKKQEKNEIEEAKHVLGNTPEPLPAPVEVLPEQEEAIPLEPIAPVAEPITPPTTPEDEEEEQGEENEGKAGEDMPDLGYRGINTMLVVGDKEPEDLVKKDGTVYGFGIQGLDFMGNGHSYVFSLNDKIYEN